MGRRKRKCSSAPTQTNTPDQVCNICLQPCPSSSAACTSCDLLVTYRVCDACLQGHVVAFFSNGFPAYVICPKPGCTSHLTNDAVRTAFLRSGNLPLWAQYLSRCNWNGTSEQWIKHFAVRCPSCRVPIDKLGGCDRMVCSRCSSCFSWQFATRLKNYPIYARVRSAMLPVARFLGRCLIAVILLLLVLCVVFYRETITSLISNFFGCVMHSFYDFSYFTLSKIKQVRLHKDTLAT